MYIYVYIYVYIYMYIYIYIYVYIYMYIYVCITDGRLSDFHKQLLSINKIVIITIIVKIHVFHIHMYSY